MKKSTLIGAILGFALFAKYALIPSVLYGGYMGLAMAGAMLGTPIEPTLFSKAITVGGMGLGLVAVMSLFLTMGALSGLAIHKTLALASRLLKAEHPASINE